MKKINYSAMSKQLELPNDDFVEAIRDLNVWVCLHVNFRDVLQKIMNAIHGRSRDLLIVVIGPARVGKTTLFEAIAGILDALALEKGRNRGCFRFAVPPPDRLGRFNWRAAIAQAFLDSGEILPFSKIEYGDIKDGAPMRNRSVLTRADQDAALFQSFIKNARIEELVTIVDEGNTIPVTLSELQVSRAIHALKDIVAQTGQPLLIFGTSAVRYIVEHDTQLKVRTKLLRLDAYRDAIKDLKAFTEFLDEMEKRLGRKFCNPGCLTSHAAEIRQGVDGRAGLAVRLATDVLSQHGERLSWKLYGEALAELEAFAGEDLAEERRATGRPIIAAAETPPVRESGPKSANGKRKGRVGATRNTNAPNHPFK